MTATRAEQKVRSVFLETLHLHGVKYVFGNPGTTENPIIEEIALGSGIRYITVLHEAVAGFAALYYASATGKCAVVNLHAAPGLGNAIGSMYAAVKARAPVIVTAGQQDTRMLMRQPLLSHDLVAMASPVTKWSIQVERPDDLASILHQAFKVALEPPRGPVFISLPIDIMESTTLTTAIPASPAPASLSAPADRLNDAASMILASKHPVIVAGDDVASEHAIEAPVALAETIGAGVFWENLRIHCSFPNQHPNAKGPLPLDAQGMRQSLEGADLVISVGGPMCEEVWYSSGSRLPEDARLLEVAAAHGSRDPWTSADCSLVGSLRATIETLQSRVGSLDGAFVEAASIRNELLSQSWVQNQEMILKRAASGTARWPLPPSAVMNALAEALPSNSTVVDESVSANVELGRYLKFSSAGEYYGGRGGGIGQGLAGAIGIQLAHPDEHVVVVTGDGSSMYGIQTLWTAAHYNLPIVFLVLANGEYRVLKHNMDAFRERFGLDPTNNYPEMDLSRPSLNFVDLARGMGVEASRPNSFAELSKTLDLAIETRRPYLIEVPMEGKR